MSGTTLFFGGGTLLGGKLKACDSWRDEFEKSVMCDMIMT